MSRIYGVEFKYERLMLLILWAGVTSFNIDFAAKKVTVVGDVTPFSVLASISKVKNAQFWPALGSDTKETKFI